ncbi:MAG: fibronectin type III domain-containing protein [Saprospiraceae bacterium]|nr:fibronectin type III domain-containing protein [Saprospiraceae bacterium]
MKKFSRGLFFIVLSFIGLSSIFAQNANDPVIIPVHPNGVSVISSKIKQAQASGIGFYDFRALGSTNFKEDLRRYGLRNAENYKIDFRAIEKLMEAQSEQISFSFNYKNQEYTLDMVKNNLLDQNFVVNTSEGSYDYQPGLYYQGVLRGQTQMHAAVSIFDNQIIGLLSMDGYNLVFQPSATNTENLIIYDDRDIYLQKSFECRADELENSFKDDGDIHLGESAPGDCIRAYIECDYTLHQNKGGVTNTVNWITAVYNNVATLYNNESINTTVSEVYVWTTADSYSKTNSITALNQFRTLRPSFNGDLAHLAALGGQNIGGVAWVDVLCTSYKYAYSNISSTYADVPTYSWTVEVMTHEMGHNVGSNHTQWCGWAGGAIDNCYTPEGNCQPGPPPNNGGTVMSYCHLTQYGINFNNGFGPLPGDKIRSRVAAVGCLGTSCGGGGGCSAPTGLNISNITSTTATAAWNAVSGATSYKFEYKKSSDPNWTQVTVTTTNHNMTGLTAATTYNTRVKAVCSSGESTYSTEVNFTTTGGGGCGIPTNLAISNITQTSANATWSAVSGATSYKFEYKKSSDANWTQVTKTSPSHSMTGLTAATAYNTRVKAVCASGESAYSSTVNFTTTGGGGCGTPTNLAASNITTNSATLSWSPVSGATSYNFQYKLNSSQTWQQANVTTTTVNMTNLTASTTYNVRVQAVCGGTTGAFTSILSFTTLNGGYCTAKGNNANYEWVARVKVGTIDRTSGKDGGYYDGSAMVTDLSKGTSYTLNHQAGTSGSSGTLYWRAWIDFNGDGDFVDGGEQIMSKTSASTSLLAQAFTVPSGAFTGLVRIRVAVRYGGYANPCGNFSYGEVEDYTINIKAAGTLIGENEGTIGENTIIYPNPFSNQLWMEYSSQIDKNIDVSIYDLFGKRINSSKLNVVKGLNSLQIETEDLLPSTYILRMDDGDKIKNYKIVKTGN